MRPQIVQRSSLTDEIGTIARVQLRVYLHTSEYKSSATKFPPLEVSIPEASNVAAAIANIVRDNNADKARPLLDEPTKYALREAEKDGSPAEDELGRVLIGVCLKPLLIPSLERAYEEAKQEAVPDRWPPRRL